MAARLWTARLTALLVLVGVFVMHGVQCTAAATAGAPSPAAHSAVPAPTGMELFGPAEIADAHAVTDMAVTRAVVVPDTAAGHPAPHPVQAAAVTGAGAGAPHGTRIKMHTPERYDSTGDLESRLLPYSHPDDYFATIDAVRQPDVGGTEGS